MYATLSPDACKLMLAGLSEKELEELKNDPQLRAVSISADRFNAERVRAGLKLRLTSSNR